MLDLSWKVIIHSSLSVSILYSKITYGTYSPLKNSWQLANEAQLLLWFFHIYIYVTVIVFPCLWQFKSVNYLIVITNNFII